MDLLALPSLSIDVTPFGFVRPSGYWIADDPGSAADQDGFSLQARLGMRAHYGGKCGVDATLEGELSPDFALKDAFIQGQPVCWLSISAGQFKIPFSLHQLTSDSRRQLPVSPRVVTAMGIGRDIGTGLTLRVPVQDAVRATLWAGMFNGEGSNRIQNVNEKFSYALRGLVTPFGAREGVFEGSGRELYVGVGGGWVYNLTGEDASAEERNSLGAEVQAAWRGLSVQGEFLDTDVFHASTEVTNFHIRGGYGQLGVFVPVDGLKEHLELVGRWEWSDPNTAFADSGVIGSGAGAIPSFQAARIISAGVNLYAFYDESKPAHFHDMKLQIAYSHPKETEGAAVSDDNVVAVATLRF